MNPVDHPALALLEFDSIATGIQAGDAMIKRAPVDRIQTGTVQPGHYLVMVVGEVAPVEEAVDAAASQMMMFGPGGRVADDEEDEEDMKPLTIVRYALQ